MAITGFSWDEGSSKHVVYNDAPWTDGDRHIHELVHNPSDGWVHFDLTAMSGAPPSLGSAEIVGYSWSAGGTKEVMYLDQQGHVHELAMAYGGQWSHTDVTATSGSPAAGAASVAGYEWPADGSKNVAFLGRDQHVHEVSWSPESGWDHVDLTEITSAPLVDNSLIGYVSAGGVAKQLAFLDRNGHLHELMTRPGERAVHIDVTVAAGAPPAEVGSIVGYEGSGDASRSIAYVGMDDHVHHLSYHPAGVWRHVDLSLMAGAPGARPSLSAGTDASGDYIVYISYKDRHVHVLAGSTDKGWSDRDVTAAAHLPELSDVHFVAFRLRSGGTQEIVLVGNDGRVHEISCRRGQGWSHQDLTTAAAAPPV